VLLLKLCVARRQTLRQISFVCVVSVVDVRVASLASLKYVGGGGGGGGSERRGARASFSLWEPTTRVVLGACLAPSLKLDSTHRGLPLCRARRRWRWRGTVAPSRPSAMSVELLLCGATPVIHCQRVTRLVVGMLNNQRHTHTHTTTNETTTKRYKQDQEHERDNNINNNNNRHHHHTSSTSNTRSGNSLGQAIDLFQSTSS